MHTHSLASEPEPTEAEIQKAAYYIWLAGGCLPGRDLENWLAAREYLKHHHGRGAAHAKVGGGAKDAPLPSHHLISR